MTVGPTSHFFWLSSRLCLAVAMIAMAFFRVAGVPANHAVSIRQPPFLPNRRSSLWIDRHRLIVAVCGELEDPLTASPRL